MREYKFRAFDRERKLMIDVGTIDFKRGYILDRNGLRWELADVELMQYTGLKDKNGIEIYEGDWLNCRLMNGDNHTRKGISEFEDGQFKVKGYPITNNDEVEIIGNIYENPELLK